MGSRYECAKTLGVLTVCAAITVIAGTGPVYAASSQSAYIRVNQVGYVTSATKRAYLSSQLTFLL